MSDDLDRVLIDHFHKTRSEAAFRALYRRHTSHVFPVVLRLVGGRTEDAEEVVQETWVRAIEQFDRFEWRSTFRSWLIGIAINCVREKWRRDGRGAWLDDRSRRVGTVTDGTTQAIDHHARIDLERAIAALPEGYRAALVLHDIEGLTHDEIGRLFGTEAVTSRTQLHRARHAVRAWLEASTPRRSSDERQG